MEVGNRHCLEHCPLHGKHALHAVKFSSQRSDLLVSEGLCYNPSQAVGLSVHFKLFASLTDLGTWQLENGGHLSFFSEVRL